MVKEEKTVPTNAPPPQERELLRLGLVVVGLVEGRVLLLLLPLTATTTATTTTTTTSTGCSTKWWRAPLFPPHLARLITTIHPLKKVCRSLDLRGTTTTTTADSTTTASPAGGKGHARESRVVVVVVAMRDEGAIHYREHMASAL